MLRLSSKVWGGIPPAAVCHDTALIGQGYVGIKGIEIDEARVAEQFSTGVEIVGNFDPTLDDELIREGAALELIRALNEQRKQEGLELTDRIELRLAFNVDVVPELFRSPRLGAIREQAVVETVVALMPTIILSFI